MTQDPLRAPNGLGHKAQSPTGVLHRTGVVPCQSLSPQEAGCENTTNGVPEAAGTLHTQSRCDPILDYSSICIP